MQASAILKLFDEDLKIIRELSITAQNELVAKRRSKDAPAAHYEHGDLVFWNPREKPTDFLASKLSPNWKGPYEVVTQHKNDVECRHIVVQTLHFFHLDRLKPFFGTYEQGLALAELDHNQFALSSINFYIGNPHKRTSTNFNVTFFDGDVVDKDYSPDLADSQQFKDYIMSKPYLFPLRGSVKHMAPQIAKMRKLVISDVTIGTRLHLNLRFFDLTNMSWYDRLHLPHPEKTYVIEIEAIRWKNNTHTAMTFWCATFGPKFNFGLDSYDLFACTTPVTEFNPASMVIITPTSEAVFPQIFA